MGFLGHSTLYRWYSDKCMHICAHGKTNGSTCISGLSEIFPNNYSVKYKYFWRISGNSEHDNDRFQNKLIITIYQKL
jgi:hypothetical protein